MGIVTNLWLKTYYYVLDKEVKIKDEYISLFFLFLYAYSDISFYVSYLRWSRDNSILVQIKEIFHILRYIVNQLLIERGNSYYDS